MTSCNWLSLRKSRPEHPFFGAKQRSPANDKNAGARARASFKLSCCWKMNYVQSPAAFSFGTKLAFLVGIRTVIGPDAAGARILAQCVRVA